MKLIFLYRYSLNRLDKKDNYGDLLSEYLVKKISKGLIVKVKYPSSRLYGFFKNYLVIGSIITAAGKNSIVWGSGIIKRTEHIRKAKFLAVRGPLTRKRIVDLGFECPEIFGDPAILLPCFFEDRVVKRYKIGIVPHYVDYDKVQLNFKNNPDVKVINLITDDIEKTTKEILECEQVVSSSLHGVIVAQSFSIPCLWVKFSEKLSGDDVKFFDYFSSMDIKYTSTIFIDKKSMNFLELKKLMMVYENLLLPKESILKKRQDELLKSCPF